MTATEDKTATAKVEDTQATKDAADANKAAAEAKVEAEQHPVDQSVLTLSKHLTAWRETYGDDVVDVALRHSAKQRKAAAAERAEAEKANAAQARAQAQARDAAPSGRVVADPKSSAKT